MKSFTESTIKVSPLLILTTHLAMDVVFSLILKMCFSYLSLYIILAQVNEYLKLIPMNSEQRCRLSWKLQPIECIEVKHSGPEITWQTISLSQLFHSKLILIC